MNRSPSIFVLLPVHNRQATTLRCLETLARQHRLTTDQVIVIDDGSTDGTAAAIRAQYPQVRILPGDGHLWWTGAIELGMRYARSQGADYLIWLNDDTLPEAGTIDQLLSFCQTHPDSIAASQCYSETGPTYGGQTKTRFSQAPCHAAPDQQLECDALDGNLVCLPASVIETIGFPEGKTFPHYAGDNFYTWKAKTRGFKLYVLGQARSFCRRDHERERWLMDSDPVWKYWQKLGSPKSCFYWKSYPIFCLRYWGIAGIVPLMSPYTRLLLITLIRLILPVGLIRWVRDVLLHLRLLSKS